MRKSPDCNGYDATRVSSPLSSSEVVEIQPGRSPECHVHGDWVTDLPTDCPQDVSKTEGTLNMSTLNTSTKMEGTLNMSESPLIDWMELHVKNQLQIIDEKLDRLAINVAELALKTGKNAKKLMHVRYSLPTTDNFLGTPPRRTSIRDTVGTTLSNIAPSASMRGRRSIGGRAPSPGGKLSGKKISEAAQAAIDSVTKSRLHQSIKRLSLTQEVPVDQAQTSKRMSTTSHGTLPGFVNAEINGSHGSRNSSKSRKSPPPIYSSGGEAPVGPALSLKRQKSSQSKSHESEECFKQVISVDTNNVCSILPADQERGGSRAPTPFEKEESQSNGEEPTFTSSGNFESFGAKNSESAGRPLDKKGSNSDGNVKQHLTVADAEKLAQERLSSIHSHPLFADEGTPMAPRASNQSQSHMKGSWTPRCTQRKRGAATTLSTDSVSRTLEAFNELPEAFKTERNQYINQVWTFLDDPESSTGAHLYAKVKKLFILCTVLVSFLQTPDPPLIQGLPVAIAEVFFDCCFLSEIIVRFGVCPSKIHFFLLGHNWAEVIAGGLLIYRWDAGFDLTAVPHDDIHRTVLLCVLPIIRLLTMLRDFETFHILLGAFALAFEALPVLLYSLLLITMVSASAIYIVEPRNNLESLPKAIWLSIVTMTTVGYGDVTPESSAGDVIAAVLAVISLLFMAMPLGIIGSAFNHVWNDRDRILLMKRTRQRLGQWGYTARDIPVLFRLVDLDNDGALDMEEFRHLIRHMNIGLQDDRVMQLFATFDSDGSGTVDAQEFVRVLFPNDYQHIYSDVNQDDQAEEEDSDHSGGDTPLRRPSVMVVPR